jgi:DNA-directed RNA polymerase beta' subunit
MLYHHRTLPHVIAKSIETETTNIIMAVASPLSLHYIDLFIDFDIVEKIARTDKVDFEAMTESDNGMCIDEDNKDFFIARDVAVKFVCDLKIKGISGISKTFTTENKITKEWYIDTQGSNFIELLNQPFVDQTRTFCDNAWEILDALGIEAAREFLIDEMTKILSFDNTYINPRHIELLVDVMTQNGTIIAVRRDGVDQSHAGPMSTVLFEKTVENAYKAAVCTDVDDLNGVASTVAMGETTPCGTGAVTVVEKM